MKTTMLLIHDVAAQAGVSVHTLRYYERAGLLPRADRSPAGYRVYTAKSVRRVRLVRMLRSLGFGIRELEALGGVEDFRVPAASMRTRLRAKRDEVGARLRDLEHAWKLLDALQGCRCRGDCVLVTRLLDDLLTIATPAIASTSPPLACVPSALGPAERKQHFEEYGPRLRALVLGARELPTGYEFTFRNDAETYRILSTWMYQERLCCPFFDFDLTLGREGGPLALRLTGRDGVKEFIESEFQPWLSKARAKS